MSNLIRGYLRVSDYFCEYCVVNLRSFGEIRGEGLNKWNNELLGWAG
jgi:hypothetical protein